MDKVTARNIWDWTLEGIVLKMLPEKALFLPDYHSLLIADPHFGKAAHFRKAGVPVPEKVHVGDYLKIQKLIQQYNPKSLIFLGDLFHSEFNKTWLDLEFFRETYPDIEFHLVKGNHDILPDGIYRSNLWKVHEEVFVIDNLLLTHEPLEKIPEGFVNLCGHIHPGIPLQGNGRQHMVLPCFFVSQNRLVLPAFGRFTGLAKMVCGRHDLAFAITDKKVIPVNFKV